MIVAVEMANQRIWPRSDGLIWLDPADNEESCPAGEKWSECDAACQKTCENVGIPVICPRMCISGCVCEDPGTVRGPDKKCIHPPLCPSADVDPDDPDRAEQDPNRGEFNSGGCPSSSACSRSCKRQGYKWGLCTGPDKTTCHCYRHM
ncbi:hypothetical protein AVEN_39012-1 [Araneus ventricosus]|uniref:Invertebrate defensins family profile domain-containing protein n=1 Tax=Araneus ventricosus TaxID=182803 RepID=A0A4Y2DPV3_ARAVE|nr:hypothetical protein AVEN_39012-1 [Araneus ventricosus]